MRVGGVPVRGTHEMPDYRYLVFVGLPDMANSLETTTAAVVTPACHFGNCSWPALELRRSWPLSNESAGRDSPLFAGYASTLLHLAALCCVLFMIVGILGNLITIVALLACKKELNATAVFIINLSASDLMFCVFNLPLAALTFWLRRWQQGYLVCQLYPLMRYGLVAVSLFTILAITINRYIMISHPNIYPKLYRKEYLLLMVASTWLCAFGTLVPTWFGKWGRFGLDRLVGSCSILPDEDGYSPKQFLFVVAFVIPCLCIVVCYARIFHIVRLTARRSHAAGRGHRDSAAASAGPAAGNRRRRQSADDDVRRAYYGRSGKLARLPACPSTDDSAIGSSSVPSSSAAEKSSVSAVVNETESWAEPAAASAAAAAATASAAAAAVTAIAARPCPNLLSPPNRHLRYPKMVAAEPSSSSDVEDDYGDECASSRSLSPSSLCGAGVGGGRRPSASPRAAVAKRARARAPSAVNATFKQVATALRRNSPAALGGRRRRRPRRCGRGGPPPPGKMSSKDRKLLKMILVIFSSFVVCYLPITIAKTSGYLSQFHALNICGYLLIYLTTCINPIIYVVMSSEYRQAYKNLLTCRASASSSSTDSTRAKRARPLLLPAAAAAPAAPAPASLDYN